MKKLVVIPLCIGLIANPVPANGAPLSAAAGETVCNQDVGNTTGVSAYRVSGAFCVIEFRNVGDTTWTVPNGVTSIDYLVTAGGGGGAGGQASEHGGGGGGAGGVRTGTLSISSSPIAISVGGGGAGGAANTAGVKGTDSTLAGSITSVGGGRGGTYFSPNAPGTGGSGGGAGVSATGSYLIGANGTTGQGNKGGDVTISGTNARHGAGGGGAGVGSVGGSTTSSGGFTISAGAGGDGISSSITGALRYFGGGGGGGGSNAGAGASGGASGGAGGGGNGATYNGSSLTAAATSGTANTGGGGGGGVGTGGSGASVGGAGGSGIIIIRYSLAPSNSVAPSISGVVTYGETLTAFSGTWLYTPTSYLYQWSRASTVNGTFSDISGATSSTYNLVTADVGQFLKVTVTAVNSGGSTPVASTATIAIPKTEKSAAISIQAGTLVYRQSKQITATSNVAGKITFLANGKRIAGCIGRKVSITNSFTVNCAYKPSTRGQVTISASFEPDDSSYNGKVTTLDTLNVGYRTSNR